MLYSTIWEAPWSALAKAENPEVCSFFDCCALCILGTDSEINWMEQAIRLIFW